MNVNAEYRRIKDARLYLASKIYSILAKIYSLLHSFSDVLFTLINLYYPHSRLIILTFTKILMN